jgi:Major Facilitator Superfamily
VPDPSPSQFIRWKPIDTPLAFLPSGMFLPIMGAQAGRLIGRFGTARLIWAGLTAFAIGYALFLREDSHHLTYLTMLLPSMLILGLGCGLGFPAMNVQATAGVANEEQGLAAGLFNTSFQHGDPCFWHRPIGIACLCDARRAPDCDPRNRASLELICAWISRATEPISSKVLRPAAAPDGPDSSRQQR